MSYKSKCMVARIGSISIPHITVANDLTLLVESRDDMQVMVWDADISANPERYCIHPTKWHILWYNNRSIHVWRISRHHTQLCIWELYEKLQEDMRAKLL